ncbi:MAG: SusE domain-containing protein [Muribaculaceae bacterium]|nr:SusE domain-containing protein [Muribaculaceae bacterium]
MKKLNYIFFTLLALLFTVSCEEPQDENPVYQNPAASFNLNVPTMASHHIDLTPEMQFKLSWSQPDYGYAASVNYTVQVSLTEDFAEFVDVNETPVNIVNTVITGEELSTALFDLIGVEDEAEYNALPASTLYVRVKAVLSTLPESETYSNVVVFNSVKGYFTLKLPGFIYLVGAPSGWTEPVESNAAHYENWKLYESSTAIGSKIYSGVFDIPEGSAQFRFYTALTGWGNNGELPAVGVRPDDGDNVDVVMTDGVFEGSAVYGKGNWQITNWAGGSMKITVNMSDPGNITVKFEAGGVDTNGKAFIFLVGAPSGWTEPSESNTTHYEDYKLYDLGDNGVYTGTFNIDAGSFEFRFYTALTGWETDSYGAGEADESTEITFSADGTYKGAAMAGKGKWKVADWQGGKVEIAVDMVSNTVKFTKK